MDSLCAGGEDSMTPVSNLLDVRFCDIKELIEDNGVLVFAELPVYASRMFYVYGVKAGDIRGYHAHKECEQFLICLKGAINVTCDDGNNRKVYTLDSPLKGLYVPSMIWAEQF